MEDITVQKIKAGTPIDPEELKKNDWKNSNENYAGLEIWKEKGSNRRMLYDSKIQKVYMIFKDSG